MKNAYQKLCEEKVKDTVIMNIEHVRTETLKEYKKLIGKGVRHAGGFGDKSHQIRLRDFIVIPQL